MEYSRGGLKRHHTRRPSPMGGWLGPARYGGISDGQRGHITELTLRIALLKSSVACSFGGQEWLRSAARGRRERLPHRRISAEQLRM